MAEICSCNTGILNFGQPNCVNSFARDSRLIFVPYLTDAGAVNSIASTDTIDSTFVSDRLNAGATGSSLDISERWYITPTINNVVGERAENVTQDIDGIPYTVKQGTRTYDGTFYGNVAATPYIKALQSMSCQNMGFFIVDVAGNLIGMNDETTGELYPIKIQRNTLQVMYKFPNSSEVQSINIKFLYEENEQDSDLSFISADYMSVNLLDVSAVATVEFSAATSIATTGFVTDMTFLYGPQFDKIEFSGAVSGDFTLNEISPTPGSVSITSVTESPDGTYTFVIAAQTSGDVLELSYQKAGFESKTSLSITIP